ncbi:MAG TPA: ATP-binding protein [Verrucomicrobiae bacterium]|jgi:PAS domain S-box-containing protein|nr:ATP-binding protein [Verrucomicrobiae bacterium]
MQSLPGSTDDSAAQREEALLRWVQQLAPFGVITLDESMQIQSWNSWMEVHSAKKSGEMEGQNLFSVFPDLKERKLTSYFERALQGESSVLSTGLHRYLLPLPSPFYETAGEHMLQTARIAPLFSEEKVCGVVLVIEDVTQRESQAHTLSRQHRRDELLSWTLAQLLNSVRPRKEIRQLFFKVAEQLDFDAFLVYFGDIQEGTLALTATGGIPNQLENDFTDCPFLKVLSGNASDVTVLNSIRQREEPEFGIFKKAGISAAVLIPLIAKDRSLGLLCFATGTRDLIHPEESDLVKTIGQYLATALDRDDTNQMLNKAKEDLSAHSRLLETKVQERTARLQETISQLETFSYTVAHDLRAPVRGTTGYCEVLLEDFEHELSEEAKTIVRQIMKISSRMDMLTRDLLEFTKISRQEAPLSGIEIEPLLKEIISVYDPVIRRTITIRSPMHSVLADKSLLQQVFSNLIENAVKFVNPQTLPKIVIYSELVPQGSPNTRSRTLEFSSTESPSPEQARAQSSPSANHVRIWVQDEGIGIAPGAHEKIFGIFERGLTSDLYPGTGIGLAIVARAMQRMGGTCGVESELGKGSRFWLDLPSA